MARISDDTPDSIKESDPTGQWTFRFDPDEHDIGEKIIFEGMPEEIVVPRMCQRI